MKLLTVLTILALASFMATSAQADSPHFIKGPTASLDTTTGDYCVSFKEAGLGNSPITYTITAGSEVFTFQCFTKSSNTPQGSPNNISLSNESAQTTLTPRNGQITGTLCLLPEKDGASCQGNGLVLKLTAVNYQNVTFCDSTNNVCVSTSDMSATLAKPVAVK
jgi:hypothetical protein